MATKNKSRSEKTAKNGSPKNVKPLRTVEPLERLRDRVEAAANEIVRLREQNREMASSISDLQNQLDTERERPALAFEDDADALRQKVRGFIKAIDTYLEHETGSQ
ncbi:MAG: hypothetical protein R3282_07730 [Rhodothermales bacterium]|nr:hypothetical protein [Rhodothermales bacterium]